MPTIYLPSSYSKSQTSETTPPTCFWYAEGSRGWFEPDQYDMIAIGNNSANTMYRAYLRIDPPSNPPASAVITEVKLRFERETTGAGDNGPNTVIWDIGLVASAPSKSFTTSNFTYTVADNLSVAKGSSYDISIPPGNWGALNQTKYIAFIGYSTSVNSYGQIPVFTGSIDTNGNFTGSGHYPHCKINYSEGTLHYGTGGIYQQCEVYYGTGGNWVKVQPYYGTGGGWQQLGG